MAEKRYDPGEEEDSDAGVDDGLSLQERYQMVAGILATYAPSEVEKHDVMGNIADHGKLGTCMWCRRLASLTTWPAIAVLRDEMGANSDSLRNCEGMCCECFSATARLQERCCLACEEVYSTTPIPVVLPDSLSWGYAYDPDQDGLCSRCGDRQDIAEFSCLWINADMTVTLVP